MELLFIAFVRWSWRLLLFLWLISSWNRGNVNSDSVGFENGWSLKFVAFSPTCCLRGGGVTFVPIHCVSVCGWVCVCESETHPSPFWLLLPFEMKQGGKGEEHNLAAETLCLPEFTDGTCENGRWSQGWKQSRDRRDPGVYSRFREALVDHCRQTEIYKQKLHQGKRISLFCLCKLWGKCATGGKSTFKPKTYFPWNSLQSKSAQLYILNTPEQKHFFWIVWNENDPMEKVWSWQAVQMQGLGVSIFCFRILYQYSTALYRYFLKLTINSTALCVYYDDRFTAVKLLKKTTYKWYRCSCIVIHIVLASTRS